VYVYSSLDTNAIHTSATTCQSMQLTMTTGSVSTAGFWKYANYLDYSTLPLLNCYIYIYLVL